MLHHLQASLLAALAAWQPVAVRCRLCQQTPLCHPEQCSIEQERLQASCSLISLIMPLHCLKLLGKAKQLPH